MLGSRKVIDRRVRCSDLGECWRDRWNRILLIGSAPTVLTQLGTLWQSEEGLPPDVALVGVVSFDTFR